MKEKKESEKLKEFLNSPGFILPDGTPIINKINKVKIGQLRGSIILDECEHSFECLSKTMKLKVLKVNHWRDKGVPLWRCRKCLDYIWSM